MSLYLLGTALLTKLYTKCFRFQSQDYQMNHSKKSAICSLFVIMIEIMISLLYILAIKNVLGDLPQYGFFLLQSFLYVIFTAIVLLVVRYEKESLLSIGITKSDLFKSVILGMLLGVIFYIFYQVAYKVSVTSKILTVTSLVTFIEFIFVGFGEEIIYRGYLQSRLVAWLGTTKGCILTAIIFSFHHLPVNIFFKGMDFQSAFFSCASIITLSLMFGYIMIKTKNITTVAILHTIMDWTMDLTLY